MAEVRTTARDSQGHGHEPGGSTADPAGSPTERARDRRRRTLMVLGALALAWVGSGLEPQTFTAQLAVAIPALGVLVIAMRRARDAPAAHPARLRLALTCWGALLVIAAGWELWVFWQQPAWNVPNPDIPTLTVLVGPAFDHRVVRFGAWLVWLYTGSRLAR